MGLILVFDLLNQSKFFFLSWQIPDYRNAIIVAKSPSAAKR